MRQRRRRIQRVAERGDRAAHAHQDDSGGQRRESARESAASGDADFITTRQPIRRQRDGREQQERVREVHGHEHRARHARVVRDELEQHEAGADGGFGEHEEERPRRAAACGMAWCGGAPRPHEEDDDGDERESAGEAMRELDEAWRRSRRAGSTSPLHSGQ